MIENNDICLSCGREYEPILWGAKCTCDTPNVIHQSSCDGCGNTCGYIIDDDYCCPERLYCHVCISKAKEKVKS